jgi:hypothetical protein
VRAGNSVHVFLTDVQHLRGEDTLWWCPDDRVFVGPAHGEAFSERGVAIGGPAQRGLDQLAVDVDAGRVVVRLDEIRLGAPRGPNADYDAGAGGGKFCNHALKIGPAPSGLLSRADAVQVVAQLDFGQKPALDPGAVFAAKLITATELDEEFLGQSHVIGNVTGPDALIWLVEVHGRSLRPLFSDAGGTYSWVYYEVDAVTGQISGTSASNVPRVQWNSLPDRGL